MICIYKSYIFFLLLILIPPLAEAAQEYSGRVVGVSDGDTIKVLIGGNNELKVRLAQIDAPEKSQAFGKRSKQALSSLIFGKEVRVVKEDIDRYGRLVGRVYLGTIDVNAMQVKTGMAWVYTKYATDSSLYDLEQEARSANIGLWSEPNPIPPWDFRHGNKNSHFAPSFSQSDSSAAGVFQSSDHSSSDATYSCGSKRFCKEMSSCAEARFYLTKCGVSRLDGDSDGVPCEKLCR